MSWGEKGLWCPCNWSSRVVLPVSKAAPTAPGSHQQAAGTAELILGGQPSRDKRRGMQPQHSTAPAEQLFPTKELTWQQPLPDTIWGGISM